MPGVPSAPTQVGFCPPAPLQPMYRIAGVTRDGARAALPGCTAKLFFANVDLLYQIITSDANGLYSFCVPDPSMKYFVRAYLPGSPDVFGTTANTLSGIAT